MDLHYWLSFPPQYRATYRAWCYTFQHVSGWTPDLDIPGGQAIFFFIYVQEKKGSTEKGK